MTTLLAKSLQGSGMLSIKSEALGRGGEGSVYAVESHSVPGLPPAGELVVKKYHEPATGNRRAKVIAMLQNSPESNAVAWPLAVVFNQQKEFVGYLMTKLDTSNYRMWAVLAHAQERKANAEKFDVRYALTASKNLAIAMYSVHQAGHRVGDVNESNIFISTDARVLLVDTDSAQVLASDGSIFPCLVGKPEYTAPELSHGPLKDQERTEASDVFAYAVAIFQMLTGGAHPSDGIFKGEDDPPSQVERIRRGWYPGLNPKGHNGGLQKVPRVASDAIPQRIKQVLYQALAVDPSNRPPFSKVIEVFAEVLGELVQCNNVAEHWYDRREKMCGWCAHAGQGRPDPWVTQVIPSKARGLPLPQQTSLPSVSFGSSGGPGPVQRAAPAVAGQQAAAAHQQASGVPTAPAPSPPGFTPGPGPAPVPQGPKQYTQEELQKMFKTKKTVLSYADGTHGVRPPLGVLFKNNYKLAISCFKDETPKLAQFWWANDRAVAKPIGLVLGLGVSIIFALLWLWLLPKGNDYLPRLGNQDLLYNLAGYIAAAGAVLASLYQALSGLLDRRKARKQYGDKARLEAPGKTAAKSVGLSVIYGPLLVVGLVGAILVLTLELVLNIIRSNGR